ncbi:MAG: chemotaxis response regulator protein-glutamate methylesterase [Planctomycetes bacterium]|nr:chemotaxis response regulator protein-glutamate methylesterase [Planctomycetota bacterium]
MTRVRVLVVDDSVVSRRFLTESLGREADLEMLRPAPNGRLGVTRAKEESPDVVILDVQMPDMDGLETITEIRKAGCSMPVIMFSASTEHGAATTLEALSRGASDYVTKPTALRSGEGAAEEVREQLLQKIRALTQSARPVVARRSEGQRATERRNRPVRAIVIGVSTGGPNALGRLMPMFPADLPVPILIVQHMPPMFTRFLAERLDKICPLHVREAEHGVEIRPGEVWLAPGNFHMRAVRSGPFARLELDQGEPENSCRPAADVLFRSAVEVYGGDILAMVLTGMGQDGLRGCVAIREAGGQILTQDRASCVVWGMPRFVEESGLSDAVLPLDELAAEAVRRLNRSSRVVTSQ